MMKNITLLTSVFERDKKILCCRICCKSFHKAHIFTVPVSENFIWIIGPHEIIKYFKYKVFLKRFKIYSAESYEGKFCSIPSFVWLTLFVCIHFF